MSGIGTSLLGRANTHGGGVGAWLLVSLDSVWVGVDLGGASLGGRGGLLGYIDGMTARARIAILLGSVVLATGCSTGAESVETASSALPSTTVTGTSETAAMPGTTSVPSTTVSLPSGDDAGLVGTVLLVGRHVDSSDTVVAVIAADGTELATFEAPVGIGQGVPFEVFSYPGSGVALIGSQQGMAWLDRSDLELVPLSDGARMQWYERGSRYAVISVRSNFEVIDLRDGSRQDIGPGFKLTRAAVSGDHIAVSVFVESEVITTVLDQAEGTAVSLPSGDQLGLIAIDGAGERLFVERRIGDDDNQMTQFVVSPLVDPLDQSVWFETTENATAGWAGDELVVAEFPSGTVTVADADGARVLGTLPDVEPRIVSVIGDRGSTAVLAEVIDDSAHRWYHIDSKRGTITEVTEASGLSHEINIEAVPGYELVSDATADSGYLGTRLAAIRIADGELIELDSSTAPRAVGGRAIGNAVLMTFTPGEPMLRLLDLDTGADAEINHGFSALLSPDGSMVAVGVGNEVDHRTVLVDISSGTEREELPQVFPVAWLGAVAP